MKKAIFIIFSLLFSSSAIHAQTWEFVGLDSMVVKQLYVFGDTIYAGTVVRNGANINAGLYFTSDGGSNWSQLDSMLGKTSIVNFEFLPDGRNTFYLVKGGSTSSPNAKLYKTTNSGDSWQLINQLEDISISWIGVSPFNGNEIYAKESHFIPSGWYTTVYRSIDGGNNWQEITYLPSSSHGRYLSFNLSMTDSNKLYAAVDDKIGGEYFFVSTNKGDSWNYISEPPEIPAELINDSKLSERIYTSSAYISEDEGYTWEVANSGLSDTSDYLSFYESSLNYNEIYTLRSDGLYKSEKDNIYWNRIEETENLPLYFGIGGFSYLDIGTLKNVAIDTIKRIIYIGTVKGIYKKNLVSGIKEKVEYNPLGFILNQNYPNPFNPSTTITYYIHIKSFVSIKVYDVLGKEIKTLVAEEKIPGLYQIEFFNSNLSSGVYFYRVVAVKNGRVLFTDTKRMILLK